MSKRNYTIEKTAGMILINKKLDKILLIRSKGGFWGFPKGHREKKEDKNSLDNAIREVKEETNIKVKKDQIISKKKYIIYQYFLEEIVKNQKKERMVGLKKKLYYIQL